MSISIPALSPTLTCDTDMLSKVKRRRRGSRKPQEANAPSFPHAPFFLCGRTPAHSKCQSSLTRHNPAFFLPRGAVYRSKHREAQSHAASEATSGQPPSLEASQEAKKVEFKLASVPNQPLPFCLLSVLYCTKRETRCRHLALRR